MRKLNTRALGFDRRPSAYRIISTFGQEAILVNGDGEREVWVKTKEIGNQCLIVDNCHYVFNRKAGIKHPQMVTA